jgi:hypothetical protein
MWAPLNLKVIINELKSLDTADGSAVSPSWDPSSSESSGARLASDLENVLWMTDDEFWSHKGLLMANDKTPPGRSTQGLNLAATRYFSQTAVRHQNLDWFYANSLIYFSHKQMVEKNERLAGDQLAGALSHGIRMLLDGQVGMGALLIGGKVLKWLVLLALISLPLLNPSDNGSLLLGLAAISYILSSSYLSSREFAAMKGRVFDRIWAANRVYGLVEFPEHIDWALLAREIADTRRAGVPWLPALEVAVRSRS